MVEDETPKTKIMLKKAMEQITQHYYKKLEVIN